MYTMVSLKTAAEMLAELASMVRSNRLRRGWTQAEMARRAGIKLPTYVIFERTGRISLLRFLKVLDVLDLMERLNNLGRADDLQTLSLSDLKAERKRGRRAST